MKTGEILKVEKVDVKKFFNVDYRNEWK